MKKYRVLLLVACLLFTTASSGGIRLVRIHQACPKTFEEWSKRREEFLQQFALMTSKEFDGIGRWAQEKLDYFAKCRKESPALMANNPGIDECWAPIMDWLKALTPFQSVRTGVLYDDEDEEKIKKEPPRKLGMNVEDAEYYRRTSKYTEIPEDIKNGQDFLRAVAKPNNLPAAYAELDKLNEARKKKGEPEIEYAIFKGNVEASGSKTLVRLMLYVPGNPAKWFSVGLPSDSGYRTPQWSAVGVHKKEDGSSDVYFKDHWREYEGNADDPHFKTKFEDVKEGKFTDACWKCHKSGLLRLPVDPSTPEADRKKVERFNQLMEETGLSGSAGYYVPEKLGPGLGGDIDAEPGLKELRDKLLPYCVADLVEFNRDAKGYTKADYDKIWNAIEPAKVTKAMNCSSCHDGVQRGVLTVPFGDILFRYIDEHRMPMGSKLNEQEIKVLKHCLKLEYSGVAEDGARMKLYNTLGEGTMSGGDSKPTKWYRGIEGVPNVPGIISGRFVRHFTKIACTPKGTAKKPAEAKQPAAGKAGH